MGVEDISGTEIEIEFAQPVPVKSPQTLIRTTKISTYLQRIRAYFQFGEILEKVTHYTLGSFPDKIANTADFVRNFQNEDSNFFSNHTII